MFKKIYILPNTIGSNSCENTYSFVFSPSEDIFNQSRKRFREIFDWSVFQDALPNI